MEEHPEYLSDVERERERERCVITTAMNYYYHYYYHFQVKKMARDDYDELMTKLMPGYSAAGALARSEGERPDWIFEQR